MIELKRIDKAHLAVIFEARNSPLIMKWCRQYAPLHLENHLSWFDWQRKDPSVEMFRLYDDDDLCTVGIVGLTSINNIARHAEFSCYIFPEHHRKGYATEGLRELFNFGFDSLNLNRIWGETFEGNPAYTLFTKKLGMKYEGTRRDFYFKDGKYLDAHLISIKKEEWYDRSKNS